MRRSGAELSSCLELFCTLSGRGSVTKRKITFLVKAIPPANVQRLRILVSSRIAFYTDNCNGVQIIKIVPGTEKSSLIQVDSYSFWKDSSITYLIRKDLGIVFLLFVLKRQKNIFVVIFQYTYRWKHLKTSSLVKYFLILKSAPVNMTEFFKLLHWRQGNLYCS